MSAPYSDRPPRFLYEGGPSPAASWPVRCGSSPMVLATGGGEPYRHEPCGTALEARWWCPSCELVVDDPADGDEVVHV